MDIETLRLTLLQNGYAPIRNRDKRTFMKNWPSVEIDEAEIRSWTRQTRDRATGLRVERGLAVIDIDVDDADAAAAIADAVMNAVPALGDASRPLPTRFGKGDKEAWFVRTSEPFSRIFTRGWVKPGETADDGVHRVEIFGGASPRQFGAFGPHTVAENGEVEVEYEWMEGVSPANVPLADLIELSKAEFFAIADAAEGALQALGWSPVLMSTAGENEPARVYDLVEGMSFDVDDGRTLSLAELRVAARGNDMRCSASWIEQGAVNRTRCLVSLTGGGYVSIWESASGVTHVEAAGKPTDYQIDVDRFAEKMRQLRDMRRLKIKPGEGALPTAAKLLELYAFCPSANPPVLPVFGDALAGGMTVTNFRLSMAPNVDEDVGPRGGRVVINPVDLWMGDARRITVAGRAMRPDREYPVYEERGEKWLNTYNAPLHNAEGGTVDAGVELLEQIAPDEGERKYLTQWLAHKWRYPHIPGPALVMVAHNTFGTGRGTFAELLGRVFGQEYVTQLSFEHVAGKTSQAQYTDWQANTLIAFVSEAMDTGAGAWHAKHDAYERLKELVETSPVTKTLIAKGKPAYAAKIFCSYIIATNHADALVVPESDRRFFVMSNGKPRLPAFWDRVREWMSVPANIAAFAQWLGEVDLAGFSAHAAPPSTGAKETMVQLGRSDLDQAFDEVRRSLVAEVFTVEQIIAMLRQTLNTTDYQFPANWQEIARKMVHRTCSRVGVRDSTNWQIKVGGRKYGVYAADSEAAAHWRTRAGLLETVMQNGSFGGGVSSVVPLVRT